MVYILSFYVSMMDWFIDIEKKDNRLLAEPLTSEVD